MSDLMADKIVCRLHRNVYNSQTLGTNNRMHALRAFYCHELKSPMSEPEKEQTWDFSIFMQVPAKALTAATTTPPGTLHT